MRPPSFVKWKVKTRTPNQLVVLLIGATVHNEAEISTLNQQPPPQHGWPEGSTTELSLLPVVDTLILLLVSVGGASFLLQNGVVNQKYGNKRHEWNSTPPNKLKIWLMRMAPIFPWHVVDQILIQWQWHELQTPHPILNLHRRTRSVLN